MNKLTLYADASFGYTNTIPKKPLAGAGWLIHGQGIENTIYNSGQLPSYVNRNDQAELLAVVAGVRWLTKQQLPYQLKDCHLVIKVDCQYVVRLLSVKGPLPKKFPDGVVSKYKELLKLLSEFGKWEVRWVKGHDKNEHNKKCDRMARAQMYRLKGEHTKAELCLLKARKPDLFVHDLLLKRKYKHLHPEYKVS